MMKQTWMQVALVGLLAGVGLGALEGLMPGAKVRKLEGSVQLCSGGERWSPLSGGAYLTPGSQLKLAESASLQVIFRYDGHREVVSGPCELTLGPKTCKLRAGSGELQRYDYRNRLVMAPNSGLQVAGGKIDNTQAGPKEIPRARPSNVLAARAKPAPRTVKLRDQSDPPTGPPFELVWENDSWTLRPIRDDFSGEVVLEDLEAGTPVQKRALAAGESWPLQGIDLRPGCQYRVRVPGLGSLSFRSLSDVEKERLAELNTDNVQWTHSQRMDAYAELGLFHLAAAEGETMLREADNPSTQVAQAVYDLYRYVLQNEKSAEYWKDWSQAHDLTLDP